MQKKCKSKFHIEIKKNPKTANRKYWMLRLPSHSSPLHYARYLVNVQCNQSALVNKLVLQQSVQLNNQILVPKPRFPQQQYISKFVALGASSGIFYYQPIQNRHKVTAVTRQLFGL
jgi:hypothetical protein